MNQEPTADALRAMRTQLEAGYSMARMITGYSVEVHRDIKIDSPQPGKP